MMGSQESRRCFLASTASMSTMWGLIGPNGWLRPVSAAESSSVVGPIRFSSELEPLVAWLETTPRDRIVPGLIEKIRSGLPYPSLLGAIFLAGIRNVQPRPNVGFKFHSVLVVHAAHQASLSATDRDRWLPLLWAADYFKRAQAEDVEQGDWQMKESPNIDRMSSSEALRGFEEGMDAWDVDKADHYATAMARHASRGQIFEALARYGCRDFRDIGHKAIYVAGAFRLLDTIGGQSLEPVVRSLTYALLNHGSGPNPAGQDLDADRPGKDNWEFTSQVSDAWTRVEAKADQTREWVAVLHQSDEPQVREALHKQLKASSLSWQTLYDGLFLASSEMVMRQNAIVPLHAVTSTNAMHYLFQSVQDSKLRLWIMMQNVAFVSLLRKAAADRGQLRDVHIESTFAKTEEPTTPEHFLAALGKEKDRASQMAFSLLEQGATPDSLLAMARNLVFSKGTDSHDYKFSSAIFEDYYHVSPAFRSSYLAGCTQLLHGSAEADTALYRKVREQFGA